MLVSDDGCGSSRIMAVMLEELSGRQWLLWSFCTRWMVCFAHTFSNSVSCLRPKVIPFFLNHCISIGCGICNAAGKRCKHCGILTLIGGPVACGRCTMS